LKPVMLTLVMGLGIGFVAGYLAAPDGAVTVESTAEPATRAPQRMRVVASASGQAEPGEPVRVVKRLRMPAQQEFADVATCTQEVARLTAAVEVLSQENAEHKKLMEHETGRAIPFPENLDPKYLEPALMRNLNKAFEEVGLDGDVSFVDCDEFPCIVCAGLGAGEGEQGDMDTTMAKLKKLKESEAMADYKDSQQLNTVMARREESDGGIEHTLNNCQAIFPDPEDAALREELQKRLSWRMNKVSEGM